MQRNGSGTSSKPVTLPTGMLTNDPSSLSDPRMSEAITSAISSPASADGPTLSGSPVGPMTDLFGRAPAPASPSAPPARARRPMTSATCGLRGYLSSPSAALQSSLESRLRRQLDGAGSTLFSLTWRQKATPAGRPYFQLAASGRPTSVSDFGSWPTPMAGTPAQKGYNEAGNTDSGRKTVALASWPTPLVNDIHGPQKGPGRQGGKCLQMTALSAWPAPNAMEGGQTSRSGKRKGELLMGGLVRSSSSAQTESPGQLNPAHSRWLMGYAPEHLSCAPTETPSSLRQQRSSSVRAADRLLTAGQRHEGA
jgi:hypothetical protein